MKTLLAKFYKALACRVAWAIVATASVANAHDLPAHFQLAPTDWGMIQQDCLGFHSGDVAIGAAACSQDSAVEFAVAQPDIGNPPAPLGPLSINSFESQDLFGPNLYDGVDCAMLESFYRNIASDDLVLQNQPPATQLTVTQLTAAQPAMAVYEQYEFHKSLFAACTCEFENQHANQSIVPPKFVLKRTYIDDYFATESESHKPLVLRGATRPTDYASLTSPLAVAIPTSKVQKQHLLADALSQISHWDCIARSELSSGYRAFQLGEFTSSIAKTWIAEALPTASQSIVEFARDLQPATNSSTSAPLYIIYPTDSGNEVAIPIAQARDWHQPATNASDSPNPAVSQEFQDMVDSASARLQWAGGRLSAAASYMNDWFSDRIARVKTSELK